MRKLYVATFICMCCILLHVGYLEPSKSIALIRKHKCSGNVNSKLIFNVSDGVVGKIKKRKLKMQVISLSGQCKILPSSLSLVNFSLLYKILPRGKLEREKRCWYSQLSGADLGVETPNDFSFANKFSIFMTNFPFTLLHQG